MSVVVDSLYIGSPVIELYPSDFVIVDGKAKLIYDRIPEIYGIPGFVEFYALALSNHLIRPGCSSISDGATSSSASISP